VRFSKSKLNTFLSCPRKFWFDYVAKLPREEPEEGPLRIGLDVHSIFEWYYLQPEAATLSGDVETEMRRILMGHPLSGLYERYIENFISYNMDIIDSEGVPGYLPKNVELSLYDLDLDFIGIMDAVYDTRDGIVIVDYKTGKSAASFEKYELEMTLYKVLYEKCTGEEVSYCGIFFPYQGVTRMAKCTDDPFHGPRITSEMEDSALELLDEVREFVKSAGVERELYRATPSYLCRFCDRKSECVDAGMYNI